MLTQRMRETCAYGLDQWVGLACQGGKNIAFIRWPPDTSESRHRRFIDLEPALLPPRVGLGFCKLREGNQAAIVRLREHRSPEGAGKVADVG